MDDQDLLTKFSCMGTQDRDVLVNDLHEILGSQLSKEGCVFFLEMSNWNLQAAVGAYYDFYGQSNIQPPQVCVVRDFPIAEGSPIPPMSTFTKTWRVKNAGSEPWPAGAYICQWSGHTLGASSTVTLLPCLRPGEEADVSVALVSPHNSGIFQSQWKMFTSGGAMCGGTLFIIVIVEDSTVMGVTERLSAITTNEGDMDTGVGGGASGGGGGASSLLGNQQVGGTDRTSNPFGGSPSSLGGPGQFNQSNTTVLPNLIPNLTMDNSTAVSANVNSSSRQLLGNSASELNALVTTLTDGVQSRLPDIMAQQDEISGTNSTQQQCGNGNSEPGMGTGPQECGNLENMMSSDDFGTGDVYPS